MAKSIARTSIVPEQPVAAEVKEQRRRVPSDRNDQQEQRAPRIGRPRSLKQAVAKAIYFRDRTQLEKIDELLSKHPRASLSSVIQQSIGAFLQAYEAAPPTDNKIQLNATIYL